MLKSSQSRLIPIILLVSLLLRWFLVVKGGQYYFSDEQRYETSRTFIAFLLSGDFTEAFVALFTAPEHLGFKIIGILPALLEQWTRESLVLPALFFSLFSVFNLYLIYQVAKRTSGNETQPFAALLFAASSMSLLYFSRHLLPYDAAMTFGLLAVYVAFEEKPNFKTAVACGALSFACFITYNGYWSLAGLAMLISSLRKRENFLQRGLANALGFLLPALLLILLAAWTGIDLPKEYLAFSSTVTQGQFDEGWSLPLEYFWHAEHFVFIILGSLALYAIMAGIKEKNKISLLWLACLIFVYLCFVIPSVFLHSFVVYGRLARQLLPFLVLLSASGLEQIGRHYSFGRNLLRIVLAVIVAQAVWNYQRSYAVTYPREFVLQAQDEYPAFDFSEKRMAFGSPTLCQNNGYIAEYVKHFEIPPEPNPLVIGQILLSAPHPDNFLPYQYEGYTYEQRQDLRELHPDMRLYKADEEFMSESNLLWMTMKSCVVKEE